MNKLIKIYPKITKSFTKIVDIKKTAQFHLRNISAIRQAISEINPTMTTASHSSVLLENLAFLTKTIIYQILLVSLPRSPQLQILLLFCTELCYLVLLIANYSRYKHLKTVILFVAKLPMSIFLMLILILSAIFSISESIERRRGARKANPPMYSLQAIGVVLILGSVVVEYILLIYKLYLSIWAYFKKAKKGEGDTAQLNEVRPMPEEIQSEKGDRRRRNGILVLPCGGGEPKLLELPK